MRSSPNFENLEAWKRGCQLAIDVCVAGYAGKRLPLRNRMVATAIAVPSNIAAGAGQASDAELRRFLSQGKAACHELRSLLMIQRSCSQDAGRQPLALTAEMVDQTDELAEIVDVLIETIDPKS